MPVAVIELKMGSAVGMPTRRVQQLLHDVAAGCGKARNAMVRHWLRWREDHPHWTPEPRRTRDGSQKQKADGAPVLEHPAMSQDLENALYSVAGRGAARFVNSNVIAHCRSEVVDLLKARLPYNHEGKARFRWEGILANEVAVPSFRLDNPIPIPSATTALTCTDDVCELEFSVLSKEAGCRHKRARVRLEKRQLPDGKRRLIERIASTPKMLRDSKIVFKRGAWFFQCCYASDETESTLDQTRQAVLTPQTDRFSHPFLLKMPDGFERRMGSAVGLESEHIRVTARRKSLRNGYRYGVAKGHGRGRVEGNLMRYSRRFRNYQDSYVKWVCSGVVEECQRNNVGSLLYREPSMPLRERVWYGAKGVPFDWTRFLAQLTHACQKRGIVLVQEKRGRMSIQPRIGIPQHKAEYPKQWTEKDESGASGSVDRG